MALAARLFERIATAIRVPQLGDKLQNWTPEPGRCHDNVASWITLNRLHQPARGWLYAPYLTLPNVARFLSHSIIVTEGGALMDVTLPSTEWTHLFILHEGSDEEFLALAINGAPWVDHIIPPRP